MGNYTILHAEAGFVVVNKLSPIPTQSDKSGDKSLQEALGEELTALEGKAPAFLEAVHRLDRRASGVLVFARTRAFANRLSEDFQSGRVTKRYWAVVDRAPEPAQGHIESFIEFDSRKDKARVLETERPGAKKASLDYALLSRSERYVLLEISLDSGRSHQIRAQLSHMGLPIRGDLKYGARRSTRNGLIMLHARSIGFFHPDSGQGLSFIAEAPESDPLWAALNPSADKA